MKIFFLLFIPIIMITCGILSWKYPPKRINYLYGYRSKKSMMNQTSWNYAQKTCGKFWFFIGIIMLIAAGIVCPIIYFLNQYFFKTIMLIVELIAILSVIPYTEIKLSKEFKNK